MQLERALVQRVLQTPVAVEALDTQMGVAQAVLELSSFVMHLVLQVRQQLLQSQDLQTS